METSCFLRGRCFSLFPSVLGFCLQHRSHSVAIAVVVLVHLFLRNGVFMMIYNNMKVHTVKWSHLVKSGSKVAMVTVSIDALQ